MLLKITMFLLVIFLFSTPLWSGEKKVRIELFWHMTEYEDWAREVMAPLFEKKNPDIDLFWTFVNDPENETVMAARLAAGNPPDLFILSGEPAFTAVEEDMLVDLSQIPEIQENLSHYPPSAFEFPRRIREKAGLEPKGIYGVPAETVLMGIFYDKNRWGELGVSPVATWDEWWKLLDKLENSGKFIHAMYWGNHRAMIKIHFWEAANSLVGHDVGPGIVSGKYKLDGPEMMQVYDWFRRMVNNYADKDYLSLEWGVQEAKFANWKYALCAQGPWVFISYPKINPEVELRAFPWPTKDGKNRAWYSFLDMRNWWMSKKYPKGSSQWKAQVRALNWIIGPEYADHMIEDVGILSMYKKEYKISAPILEYMWNQDFPLVNHWDNTCSLYIPSGQMSFNAFVWENLPKLTSGEMSSKEFGKYLEDWYAPFRPK